MEMKYPKEARRQKKKIHEARSINQNLSPEANLLTQHIARINHDFISAHRGSQEENMRVEIASKIYLWNYLCYL
jgi:hypothetical protein